MELFRYTRGMSAAREPPVDPSTLRDSTVRRGANKYWWMVIDDTWQPIGNHKTPNGLKKKKVSTRKRNKRPKEWEASMGIIMVRYNVAESCDRKDGNRCIIPELRGDGEWSFSNPFTPYSPKEKYVYNDEYAGNIQYMGKFKAQLNDTFSHLKEQGIVTEFIIIDTPFRDRSKLFKH